MSEERDLLISAGHDYDGIKEYDNPLPRWWVYMFYLTIIFAFWYSGYYLAKAHAMEKAAPGEEAVSWSVGKFKLEQAKADRAQSKNSSAQTTSIADIVKDPEAIERGRSLYAVNCIACHSPQGQGLVGPNLVDKYWIHGYTPEEIQTSIAKGFPTKGMVAWEGILGKRKVQDLTAFVMSIEGNTVDNPKVAEGTLKPE